MVQLDELERQVRLEQVDDQAGPAVPGVDHHLQRFQRRAVDVAQQVLDEVIANVDRLAPTTAGRRAQVIIDDRPLDLLQSGIGADRPRVLADQLQAVVVLGIVTGGDHDPAVEFQVEGGEVDLFGAAQPDVQHLHTGLDQSAAHRLRQLGWHRLDQRDVGL